MKYPRNEVEIPLPSWTIVDEQKHAKVGLPTSTTLMKDPAIGLVKDFLPLFSSYELACTFIEQSNGLLAGHVPLKLDSINDARDLLVKLLAAGGDHVGVDVCFRNGTFDGGKWTHIAIVLAAINATLN